jgi:hypothetical protein
MSELLNALNPAAARKRTRDEYEYTSGMFDAYLQPILVRPAVPTHRSELEYAMMDTTKLCVTGGTGAEVRSDSGYIAGRPGIHTCSAPPLSLSTPASHPTGCL